MKRHRCPDCGGPLVHAEGCATCPVCGFTACGRTPVTALSARARARAVRARRPRRAFAAR